VSVAIAPIVEGHAEVESVPVLLRRILATLNMSDVQVVRPFRVKRTRSGSGPSRAPVSARQRRGWRALRMASRSP